MFNYLVAIVSDVVKNNEYGWLLAAAAISPLLALLAKKRKQGWLQHWFLKKANSKKPGFLKKILLKRFVRRSGKKMSDGLLTLLIILGLLGLGALMIWLLGLGTSLLIVLIIVILVAFWKIANPKEPQ